MNSQARILIVHNYYQQPGGEDAAFDSEAQLLEAYGHEVRCLTFDNREIPAHRTLGESAKLAAETVWSRRAATRLREVIRQFHPDIVHFHNTFPLISPACYTVAKIHGCGVVQTLHNYRLLCSNALFSYNNQPCEECLHRMIPWPAVKRRCYRGSRNQSAVVALMQVTHRIRRTWSRDIDTYIALSQFSREKFVYGGLPAQRVEVKPNFVAPDPGAMRGSNDYFFFAGRLDQTKGIDTLLHAWACAEMPTSNLQIAGDGPLAELVSGYSLDTSNVNYLGRINKPQIIERMRNAQALVLPTLLYENCPMILVEAFACGLPVIASQVGVLEEVLQDGYTGLHFRPGDPNDLAAKLRWVWDHPEEMARMGRNARREFELKYTAERNYEMLMDIYRLAIERAQARR